MSEGSQTSVLKSWAQTGSLTVSGVELDRNAERKRARLPNLPQDALHELHALHWSSTVVVRPPVGVWREELRYKKSVLFIKLSGVSRSALRFG